jgi:acetylornithine deacetylase/succinyl-diaminopimelate desuccinylase-like protein
MNRELLLHDLSAFLSIPSVSTAPAHDADCRRAADWVVAELERLGCREIARLGSDKHPVVWGKGPEVPGAPTLLLYGHYDVQPPDPLEQWTSPPFEPTIVEAEHGRRIVARGAVDDTGQLMTFIEAFRACRDVQGALPIRVTPCSAGTRPLIIIEPSSS